MSVVEDLRLTAHWSLRPLTLGEYVDLVRNYLCELGAAYKQLAYWSIDVRRKPWHEPLDPDFSRLYELVRDRNFSTKDRHQYHRLGADGCFVSSSMSNYGFFSSFASCSSLHGILKREQGGAVTEVDAGSPWPFAQSDASVRLPRDQYGELHELGMVRRLLDVMLEAWQPTRATVASLEFEGAAYGERMEHGRGANRSVWPGWMTYIRMPQLGDYLPADIDFDELPDGGTLIYASRERPSANDTKALDRARRILDVLDNLCISQEEVLIDGWPDDAREMAYAQQITGAPPGRAYRVALADFSGYDPDRGVLLWAKLFPYWNANIFAYKPTFVKPLECKPVVAEARRQLRSLELAKAKNPIEWHIGREELVEPLQTLLHVHAEVPRKRLSVVYTPFEEQPGQ